MGQQIEVEFGGAAVSVEQLPPRNRRHFLDAVVEETRRAAPNVKAGRYEVEHLFARMDQDRLLKLAVPGLSDDVLAEGSFAERMSLLAHALEINGVKRVKLSPLEVIRRGREIALQELRRVAPMN